MCWGNLLTVLAPVRSAPLPSTQGSATVIFSGMFIVRLLAPTLSQVGTFGMLWPNPCKIVIFFSTVFLMQTCQVTSCHGDFCLPPHACWIVGGLSCPEEFLMETFVALNFLVFSMRPIPSQPFWHALRFNIANSFMNCSTHSAHSLSSWIVKIGPLLRKLTNFYISYLKIFWKFSVPTWMVYPKSGSLCYMI